MYTSLPQTPNNPTPQETSNKKREVVLGVILVITLIIGARYLMTRNNPNSSSSANLQNPILEENEPVYNNGLASNNEKTVEMLMNAYLSKPYFENRNNLFIDVPDYYIPLMGGEGSFSYCESDIPCTQNNIKQGIVTLSNISLFGDPTLFQVQNVEQPANNAIALLKFNFNNENIGYYLGVFRLTKYYTNSHDYLEYVHLEDLGTFDGSIENISIIDNGELTITTRSSTGALSSRIFLVGFSRRSNSLIELTPDKQYKVYKDKKLGFSFVYPRSIISFSYPSSLKDGELERELNISPIYHSESCDLEPTFADSKTSYVSYIDVGSNLPLIINTAELSTHKINGSAVFLTSSLFGYDPLDWGKIKQALSVKTYAENIKTGASIPGKKVSLENIEGHSVRHIMPYIQGRPCENKTFEQYQWVMGDTLFNLIFTESTIQPFPLEQKKELIDAIFRSIKLNN